MGGAWEGAHIIGVQGVDMRRLFGTQYQMNEYNAD